MSTNKKLNISITKNKDREAIEVLRKRLEAKSNNEIRYSLAEAVLIAVNSYLDKSI